jgi:predicted permease
MSWRKFLHRAKWDRERRAEIESYIEIETEENVARGLPQEEARAAARRKFGNSSLVCEEIYHMNTVVFADTLARDVRYALRALRRNPAFTVAALLTIAIGIGANTAVFSVVNSVLLNPLPYPRPDRLVAVSHDAPGAAGLVDVSGGLRLSASMFFTYSAQNRTFESMGIWTPGAATVTGLAEPEQVRTVWISDGVLQSLAVPPARGRWLSHADQVPGGPATMMLGYAYWQRRFGGDRSVIGRSIQVDGQPREIVGVMPEDFRLVNADADLVVPLAFDRGKLILPGFGFLCVGRLMPGVTVAQAGADMARLVPVWMNSWPAYANVNPRVYEGWRITPSIRPLKQDMVGSVGRVLWVVMATIGMVMLIACANVANLLLVRAESRQQELAVRAALGAGWGRIARELLIESVLLGIAGGAIGLGLAYAGVHVLVAAAPANLPRLNEIGIDGRVLAFALAASVVSGFLFGLIPAVKYAGPRIAGALRSSGRSASESRERHRARNVLAVAQVALALVLLVSSGLMIRTFQTLSKVDPGFAHAAEIQILRTSIPTSMAPEPARVARMQNDIVDRLAAIPGVSAAAFTSEMPMEGAEHDWDVVCAEGQTVDASQIPPLRVFKSISPGLFYAMGTRLVAGRDYTWDDLYGRRSIAIVSESLARELWKTPAAAIGKRISTCVPKAPLREVIGVVADIHENGLQEPATATVYWPSFRDDIYTAGRTTVERTVTFTVHSARAGTESFLRQVHEAVWAVNPNLPLADVRTMGEVCDRSLARTSFTLVMLGIASIMALLLGLIGIYGVVSYVVSQRRKEIGIRLALGAQPSALSRMFVRYGLALSGIGAAVGLCGAALLMRLMKSLLFGVSPLDPLTYAAVPVILVSAAIVASYLPARRAAAIDPVEALKAE